MTASLFVTLPNRQRDSRMWRMKKSEGKILLLLRCKRAPNHPALRPEMERVRHGLFWINPTQNTRYSVETGNLFILRTRTILKRRRWNWYGFRLELFSWEALRMKSREGATKALKPP